MSPEAAVRPQENGRSLPVAETAERGVLGAIMADGSAASRAADLLPPDAFADRRRRAVYEAALRVDRRGQVPDVNTIRQQLEDQGELEAIGGPGYLAEFVDWIGPENLESYADQVRSRAALRWLVQAGREIQELAGDTPPGSGEEALDAAEDLILEVSRKTARGDGYVEAGDRVMSVLHEIHEAQESEGRVTGLETGFDALDRMTTGLHPGDLFLLAARPGMGKTSLALDITRHLAIDQHRPVGFLALEGDKDGIVRRLLCADAAVPVQRARAGDVGPEEEEALAHAAGRIQQATLPIEDTSGLTTSEIRSRGRRMVEVEGAELLVVDYLQRARAPGAESRVQEVSRISRALADLAEELEVPVLALSQLSRAPDKRGDHRPVLADLRDTGELEQDADVVAFLYREAWYADPKDDRYDPADTELIIAKQRDGPTGAIDLHFDAEIPSFREEGS